jgi:hypothetical protein
MMKKLLLSALGLLSTSAAFAQLTVKADANDASYIYVSDEVLFVTDDVSIDRANATDDIAKAGIFKK